MKTLKTTLLISMLLILTTSCTDLTDNLVPETKTENIELNTTILDTGDDEENTDGSKGGYIDTGDDEENTGGDKD